MQETASSYPVDEDFDPLSEDYLEDPYAYYARFRREAPIFFAPKIGMWVVSRYEDILAIVKDPETFSSARVQEPLQELEPEAAQHLNEGVRVHRRSRTPTRRSTGAPASTLRRPSRRSGFRRSSRGFAR